MAYLKKFIENKLLNTNQCPARLSPRNIPRVMYSSSYEKYFLRQSNFGATTRCGLPLSFPQVYAGNHGSEGRIPHNSKKNLHPYQKNLRHHIVIFM